MSKCVAILYLLFGFGLSVDPVPCKTKTYTLSTEASCYVQQTFLVDFEVKSIEPRDICNSTEKICLSIPTRLHFLGTFTDGDILSISGFTEQTAQIPVVENKDKRVYADPEVATFLDDGKGAATEVKADQPIKITLPSTVTIDSSTGCQVTPSGQPCGGLCCTLDGRQLLIWGTKPATTKAINIKSGDSTVYIPCVVKTATDVDPNPLILLVGPGGSIATSNIDFPFLPASVKIGQTELPSIPTSVTSCAAQCYQIANTVHSAEFKGKMLSSPIAYTIKGTERVFYYTFTNAVNAMRTGGIALVTATAALFASRF